nr:MAG TPA: LAGLIDADG-like domain [Crassvirales sp.]
MNLEKENLIKTLYERGYTFKEIKNQAQCSSDSINKVRDKYNLPKRSKNFKTEPLDEDKIIELYTNGCAVSTIYKECRCSSNTVTKVLRAHNIPLRTDGIRKLNKQFDKFYDLNSPETQYWLGYICADGNIEYNNGTYKISLFSKEEEPINKFVSYFGKDTVSVHKRPTGIIEAYINSKKLCDYFINTLNITPNKSLILNPNIKYTNHFILGYFDGDGCIRNSSEKQTRYECNITCASKIFIDKVKNVLDKVGIYSIVYKHTDCNAYKIRIDRKEESRKFYCWLYKNAPVYLSRKFNNFAALFGNLEDKKLDELQENVENLQPSQPLTKLEGSTTNS